MACRPPLAMWVRMIIAVTAVCLSCSASARAANHAVLARAEQRSAVGAQRRQTEHEPLVGAPWRDALGHRNSIESECRRTRMAGMPRQPTRAPIRLNASRVQPSAVACPAAPRRDADFADAGCAARPRACRPAPPTPARAPARCCRR